MAIKVGNPRQPLRPGRYFRVTTADGNTADLYVGVSRTTVDPSYAHRTQACLNGTGRVLASPWNGLIYKCSLTRRESGSVLLYYVSDMALLQAEQPPQRELLGDRCQLPDLGRMDGAGDRGLCSTRPPPAGVAAVRGRILRCSKWPPTRASSTPVKETGG
ncbi:hypothetical protein ACRAWF_28275 [Streptomyces sp. L7]